MRPKKKGRKKTLDIKEFKKPSNPIEVKSVDTSAEPVSYTHLDVYKRQCMQLSFLLYAHHEPKSGLHQ